MKSAPSRVSSGRRPLVIFVQSTVSPVFFVLRFFLVSCERTRQNCKLLFCVHVCFFSLGKKNEQMDGNLTQVPTF